MISGIAVRNINKRLCCICQRACHVIILKMICFLLLMILSATRACHMNVARLWSIKLQRDHSKTIVIWTDSLPTL